MGHDPRSGEATGKSTVSTPKCGSVLMVSSPAVRCCVPFPTEPTRFRACCRNPEHPIAGRQLPDSRHPDGFPAAHPATKEPGQVGSLGSAEFNAGGKRTFRVGVEQANRLEIEWCEGGFCNGHGFVNSIEAPFRFIPADRFSDQQGRDCQCGRCVTFRYPKQQAIGFQWVDVGAECPVLARALGRIRSVMEVS